MNRNTKAVRRGCLFAAALLNVLYVFGGVWLDGGLVMSLAFLSFLFLDVHRFETLPAASRAERAGNIVANAVAAYLYAACFFILFAGAAKSDRLLGILPLMVIVAVLHLLITVTSKKVWPVEITVRAGFLEIGGGRVSLEEVKEVRHTGGAAQNVFAWLGLCPWIEIEFEDSKELALPVNIVAVDETGARMSGGIQTFLNVLGAQAGKSGRLRMIKPGPALIELFALLVAAASIATASIFDHNDERVLVVMLLAAVFLSIVLIVAVNLWRGKRKLK